MNGLFHQTDSALMMFPAVVFHGPVHQALRHRVPSWNSEGKANRIWAK
jgi:hypothetical protein